jgi:uncharacterized membrane protein YuzA (DUF378 family)
MDFSKLGQYDRIALAAAVVVVATGLLSLANDWGLLMAISLLAGIGVLFVVLQPQIAPAMKLPATRGMTLLALGALAVLATGLTAFNWLGWIFDHLVSFDTIQFIVGLIAAVVMAYAGWMAYQGERPTASAPVAPPPPAA